MKRIVTAVVASCAAVAILAVPTFARQTVAEPHAATHEAAPPCCTAAKCQAMMAEHEKMMADMNAADQRLDGLVATMNTASGMDRVAATAAVVTEMVTQRRTMRDGMAKMQHGMMEHMMGHMQAGKDSMAGCPMMKTMGDKKH